MNPSKNRILSWAVFGLVIINVAVLIIIWSTLHKRPERPRPSDYLIKELGLSNEQQKKFLSLAGEHRRQAQKIREQVKEKRHDLFKLLEQPNIDDSSKKAAAAGVAKNLEELDLLTFDHFQQLRAICTPGQQKKFDEIIEEVLQMIASGPPPGRPPHDGGHRPPPGN